MANSKPPSSSGAHILVFPFPAQGHMIPLLDLAHHLSRRGLSITILVTPKNLPLLSPLLSESPTIQTLVLPFPKHPSLPPGVENIKDILAGVGAFVAFMQSLYALHDPVLQWFQSHPDPPVAIISDFFLGWTHNLACKLSIRRIAFSPSGALTLSLGHFLWRTLPKPPDPADLNSVFCFQQIPNSPKYPWWQISPLFRSYKEGDPPSELVRESFLANTVSWGFVFNSFTELEGEYLEYMKRDLGHSRVWAVGPILPEGRADRGGASAVPAGELMSWLDGCPDGSVVFVCFGSLATPPRNQMEALANGLDASGVRFLWCIKAPTTGHVAGNHGVVPAGFEERVAGRGLVVKGWAPQVAILSHKAIGSFLTHCGWNSVLEAIIAGVPMLAWPRSADQFTNAGLLVDDMGVAVRVCEGPESVPDSGELARVVTESVGGDWAQRGRAKELSRGALDAVSQGGSSFRDLDGLVSELQQLSVKGSQCQRVS